MLWWAVCFKIVNSKMLSLRLQIAIISTRWSTKSIRFVPRLTRSSEVECTCIDSILWKSNLFVPHSTRSSEVECIDSILWKSSWFVPRSIQSSTVEKIDSIRTVEKTFTTEIPVWKSTRSSHHLHSEFGNGTGPAHTRSKHVHRGRCYFTGLMSFSFTSYFLLLSFFAVRLMCIGCQWLSLYSGWEANIAWGKAN